METIADYELIRSLGSGNHGQFFLARKPARLPVDVEFVAVKVFAGTSTADTFRRATDVPVGPRLEVSGLSAAARYLDGHLDAQKDETACRPGSSRRITDDERVVMCSAGWSGGTVVRAAGVADYRC